MALLSYQNWAKVIVLSNVALDQNNGPHLGGCMICVPVVTVLSNSYTLLNNYYQLGQISNFVPVGATRIASTVNAHGVFTVAFKNSNGVEELIATNINSGSATFEVTWNGQRSFSYTLPSKSTVTFQGTVASAPSTPTTPRAGQTYRIVNKLTGKPFGVAGASTANGAQIVQWTNDADPDQQWTLIDAGGGWYTIVDVNSGLALDDPNGSASHGSPMPQRALNSSSSHQQWQLTSAGGGHYTLTNRTSGLRLQLKE